MNAFVLVLPWFAPVQTAVLPAFPGGHFPFLSMCFVATFLFHLVTLPSEVWRLLVPVAVLSEVPSLLSVHWPGSSPPFGCGLALSATLLRLALAVRAHGPQRERHWRALVDALVPPPFFAATVGLLGLASYLTPFTRDLEIQRIGGVLGPWPPIIVARWFESVAPMRVLCQAIYVLLPIELAALFQARRVSRGVWSFAAVWFAGTELATLGLGEHWLIDLVVAVPFAYLAYALADGAAQYRERRRAMLATPLLALAVSRRLWGAVDGNAAEARPLNPAQDRVAAAQL